MCSENGIVLAFNWQPLQAKCFAAFPTSHTHSTIHLHLYSMLHSATDQQAAPLSTRAICSLNCYITTAMLCTTCNERQLIEFHYLSHDDVIDQRHRPGGNHVPALQLGQVRWQMPIAPPHMAISSQIRLCFWGDYSCNTLLYRYTGYHN